MGSRRASTRFVISGLRRERAYLAGEIDAAERNLARLRATPHNLEMTLLLFDAESDPAGIQTILAVERGKYFRHGEQTCLILTL